MTTYEYKGYKASVRLYTTEELKRIDEALPHTGSSQEPGFYFDELDDDGEEIGGPSGPFKTEEEAKAGWRKVCDKL